MFSESKQRMKRDKRSLILLMLFGIFMGAAGILNVMSHANIRWVDVAQIFIGGLVCGAMLANGFIGLRSGAE
jgi:hypothetical protein